MTFLPIVIRPATGKFIEVHLIFFIVIKMFYFRGFHLKIVKVVVAVCYVMVISWYMFQKLSNNRSPVWLQSFPKSTTLESNPVIPVLVLVCDRTTVIQTLDQLFKYRPNTSKFPIVISQDCATNGGDEVEHVLKSIYGTNITYMVHPNYEVTKARVESEDIPIHMRGYHHIAVHYGWALNQIFNVRNHTSVIIVEDDLDISPDFFEYFEATLPLLYQDPTIWCVSAYNNNGQPSQIDKDATDLLYRSDFFSGLGWMMIKPLWQELKDKWPDKYWDDWLREHTQRKGRACIYPEISRTKTYGKIGASGGQFYDKYLKGIFLNDKFVPFTSLDLSYLAKTQYDQKLLRIIKSTTQVSTEDELRQSILSSRPKDMFRVMYRDNDEFVEWSNVFSNMEDFKDGVPRGGYQGIVPIMFSERRVYIVPTTYNLVPAGDGFK